MGTISQQNRFLPPEEHASNTTQAPTQFPQIMLVKYIANTHHKEPFSTLNSQKSPLLAFAYLTIEFLV